jgi:hypothetical protein
MLAVECGLGMGFGCHCIVKLSRGLDSRGDQQYFHHESPAMYWSAVILKGKVAAHNEGVFMLQ